MAIEVQGGKPIQRISESEKNADGKKFYQDTADFYIRSCIFDEVSGGSVTGSNNNRRNRKQLYEVYNNQIPLEWFSHITNPYNTNKAEYQRWPSKIRPTTILRTNLDLLMSEYPKRPFSYFISNLGEDAMIRYTEGLNTLINQTLQRKFIQMTEQTLNQSGVSMGHTAASLAQQQIPTPDEVATAYKAGYKDKVAIRGQKLLKRSIVSSELRRKLLKMFKDWLIVGEMISYKGVKFGKVVYNRLSPLDCDYDKSPEIDFYEDGEWFVHRSFQTISDITDNYYEDLKDSDLTEIEKVNFASVQAFYSYTQGLYTDHKQKLTKIPVYHVAWKGKKKLLKVTRPSDTTGEPEIDWLDEDYVLADGEKSETFWVNCVYEVVRIGDKIYPIKRELPNQVSQLNNFSYAKLPFNGKCFSDLHAQNISVMEIGLPFQIMYIIVTRALEMTIAKSKGKIILMDKNVIPKGAGWDEDKFFYYADALGWGLINRNQVGVDKSYNQYQVLDLTLYDSIKQLIMLQQHIKDEWDDTIGISRQRKAETFASDTAQGNTEALVQSTVMTDMIFIGFEEFQSRELQGILDLTRFCNLDGKSQLYNESEFDYDMIEADPNEYAAAELGVFVTDPSVEGDIFKKLESYIQPLIQNGAKPSTVIELITAENVATLKAVMRKAEDLENQAAQAAQQSEVDKENSLEEIKERYAGVESTLKTTYMNAEYDRKENIEYIKGAFAIDNNPKANDGDNNDNNIPDVMEIMSHEIEREKIASKERVEAAKITEGDKERAHVEKVHAQDNQVKREEIASRIKIARSKPRPSAN